MALDFFVCSGGESNYVPDGKIAPLWRIRVMLTVISGKVCPASFKFYAWSFKLNFAPNYLQTK
jgi:hypothetical protein